MSASGRKAAQHNLRGNVGFGMTLLKAASPLSTTFRSFVRFGASVKSRHSFSLRLWAALGMSVFFKSRPRMVVREHVKRSSNFSYRLVCRRPILDTDDILQQVVVILFCNTFGDYSSFSRSFRQSCVSVRQCSRVRGCSRYSLY